MLINDQKKFGLEKILTGAAFTLFFLITCYKLTNAPLWFDETIEYWFSKVMFGELPFSSGNTEGSTNMYQRIITTFQPPLYNFVMYFWLLISSGEWWFRFFGVVMGFIANIAIYKSVKKMGNGYIAAVAVMFSSCVLALVCYWQECSEYCLVLCTLAWSIYFLICVLEKQSTKNIVLFTIFAILPIYSQYGAAFVVIPMVIAVYVYILIKKNKKAIIEITISYLSAFIFAAIPLYFLFLKKQMMNQHGGEVVLNTLNFNGNILRDLFESLIEVVRSNFFAFLDERVAVTCTIMVIICVVIVMVCTKKNYVRFLGLTNILAWLLYYFAVRSGAYAYGVFGNRYNLFFLPLWIITFFCFVIEIYKIIENKCAEKYEGVKYYYIGICLCAIICFMYLNWSLKLQYNWDKENMRGAVNQWAEQGAYNSNTIVYYGGDSGFAYYIRQLDNYTEDMETNVNYMPWYGGATVDGYVNYVNAVYGEDWPEEVYIIGSHIVGDFENLVSAFTSNGYVREDIYTHYAILTRFRYVENIE